jgi:hypothetical protein
VEAADQLLAAAASENRGGRPRLGVEILVVHRDPRSRRRWLERANGLAFPALRFALYLEFRELPASGVVNDRRLRSHLPDMADGRPGFSKIGLCAGPSAASAVNGGVRADEKPPTGLSRSVGDEGRASTWQ